MTRTHTYAAIEVALKSLAVHAANVRARSAEACSETSVQALAANIREVGLLQPLLVQETKRGQYGVLAGSRRLAALNLLAADKKAKGFGPRMKVTCHLVPENAPVTAALSLSENEMQAPMDAIDRYEAFAVLRDADGLDVADIARLFGLAERAVRETLRIGLIAADIRAAHRAGDISLETLKAFARHPDPAVQSGVFTALASEGFRVEEWRVRRALEDHGVRQGDALGAFVLETYRKAGGAIAPDLIEEDSVLSDPGLVQTVLAAKLGDLAEEARARCGMGWAEHRIDPDREAFSAYGCIYPQPADPDETAQARLDALTAKHDEVADAYDAADDRDAQSRLGDECEAVSAEIDALTHAYDPGEAANAGVIAIWQHGGLRLLTGMVRPEDRADAVKKTDATSDEAGPKISARLASDMAIERTRAVGLALAQDPATARVYGDWLLVGNVAKGLGLATDAVEPAVSGGDACAGADPRMRDARGHRGRARRGGTAAGRARVRSTDGLGRGGGVGRDRFRPLRGARSGGAGPAGGLGGVAHAGTGAGRQGDLLCARNGRGGGAAGHPVGLDPGCAALRASDEAGSLAHSARRSGSRSEGGCAGQGEEVGDRGEDHRALCRAGRDAQRGTAGGHRPLVPAGHGHGGAGGR